MLHTRPSGPIAPAVILAAIAAGIAHAQNEYSFTLVDAFVTDYDLRECYIYDISDENVACGTATIELQVHGGTMITYSGFYWTAEDEKTPAAISWPRGINNNGLMAGVSGLFDIPTDQFTSVPPLPSLYFPLVLLSVNDAGVAVGYEQICNCSNSQGSLQVPYVWDAVNGARSLDVPGAKGAARINTNGLIVGWTGGWSMPDSYLYDLNTDTSMFMSSVFEGPNVKTTAADVSDNDVVVGSRLNSNGTISHGYTWSAKDGVTLLPLPPEGFQPYVTPTGINSADTIVGAIYTPLGSSRAFVYDASHGIRDLSTLTDEPAGFTLMTATAINDNGWIVGYGYGGGGMYKSFVLMPVASADLTGDGTVGPADLAELLAQWGACPPPESGDCPADLSGDGTVGPADLAELLADWA